MILGLWSVMRFIMHALMSTKARDVINEAADQGVDYFTISMAIASIVLVMSGIGLAIRLFIGFSARAEGMEKNKGRIYPILALILTIYTVFTLVYDCIHFSDPTDEVLYVRGAIIMDVISLYAIAQLVISVYRVRRYVRIRSN